MQEYELTKNDLESVADIEDMKFEVDNIKGLRDEKGKLKVNWLEIARLTYDWGDWIALKREAFPKLRIEQLQQRMRVVEREHQESTEMLNNSEVFIRNMRNDGFEVKEIFFKIRDWESRDIGRCEARIIDLEDEINEIRSEMQIP